MWLYAHKNGAISTIMQKLQPLHFVVLEVFVDAMLHAKSNYLSLWHMHTSILVYILCVEYTCTCSLLQYRLCIKLMLAIELVENLQNVTLCYVRKSVTIF